MSPDAFDDDFRPRPRVPARPAVATEPEPTPAEAGPRPLDDGSGHTRQAPEALRALSAEELAALQKQADDADWQAIESELTAADTLWGWPKLVSHPMVGLLLLGSVSVLGLFLVNQVSATVATLSAAPAVWQWIGGVALGLLGVGAVYAIARVVAFYYRLQRNEPVRLQLLRELEERKAVRRWVVNAQWAKAWERIETYLRNYPLMPAGARGVPANLRGLAPGPELFAQLTEASERLLDRNRFLGEDQALQQFQQQFQSRLDTLAQQRIRYWANRTALATTVSPNGLADSLATLYCSFSMLGDLCAIYHLRTNRTGTAILLARIFLNAYLAGQLNELEELTGESAAHLLSSNLPINELMARVVGRLSAKVGSGMVNYFLLHRLGAYACKLLRPVDTR